MAEQRKAACLNIKKHSFFFKLSQQNIRKALKFKKISVTK
jgi:hypothetical protein